jgi:hypothetical protein
MPPKAKVDQSVLALKEIDKFNGTAEENSLSWSRQATRAFEAFSVPDHDRVRKIPMRLCNEAAEWYDTQGSFSDWSAFITALLEIFPPPDKVSSPFVLSTQINNRIQRENESVHDYYYSMTKLCRQYDDKMSDREYVTKLVNGLKPSLKKQALIRPITNAAEFFTEAKLLESAEHAMAYDNERTLTLSEPTFSYDENGELTTAAVQSTSRLQSIVPQERRSMLDRRTTFEQQQQQKPMTRRSIQDSRRQEKPPSEHFFPSQRMNSRPSMNSNYSRTFDQSPLEQNGYSQSRFGRPIYSNQYYDRQCYVCGQYGHLYRQCPQHLNM